MIEIKLPNGVSAVSADLRDVRSVFRVNRLGGPVEFHSGETAMGLYAYFTRVAAHVFNLVKCDHCQTWSKVKGNCGNCLRAERDIAQYNLKQERDRLDLADKNLAAANERIAGLETMVKTAIGTSLPHTEGCGCVWEFHARAEGATISLTKKQVKSCDGGFHFVPWFNAKVYRSPFIPAGSVLLINSL